MAIRLPKAFGGSPEVWLRMQLNYDLWQAQPKADRIKIERYVPAGIERLERHQSVSTRSSQARKPPEAGARVSGAPVQPGSVRRGRGGRYLLVGR